MELIQVTLYDKLGKYRPISTLCQVESIEWFKKNKEKVKIEGVIKICQKRGWTQKELEKYNYKTCKMRVYNPEKIKQEAKEKYEKIKKDKGWI